MACKNDCLAELVSWRIVLSAINLIDLIRIASMIQKVNAPILHVNLSSYSLQGLIDMVVQMCRPFGGYCYIATHVATSISCCAYTAGETVRL